MCNFNGNVLFTELGSDTMRTCLKIIETYLLLGPQEFLQVRALHMLPTPSSCLPTSLSAQALCPSAFIFSCIGKKPASILFPSYPSTALNCCHHNPLYSHACHLSPGPNKPSSLIPSFQLCSKTQFCQMSSRFTGPPIPAFVFLYPTLHYHYPTLNTSILLYLFKTHTNQMKTNNI